jgi:DNA-binding CsgD family transcriptional regulator
VIEGEAGIGKTALLRSARELAAIRGTAVLQARGSELEIDYPFGVARQCLEPPVRAADRAGRERLLSGAAALAAPVVLDAVGDQQTVSFDVLHGLYWLLANLADHGPLLVLVDDAHWADEASLRFLAHAARRVESLALTLIVATRPIDDHDRCGILGGLLGDPVVELLAPCALDESAVAELLGRTEAHAVDEAFSRACHHATGGNPFLLAELVVALHEQDVAFTADGSTQVTEITPPQVARATRARLARLDPAAAALARAIAVLGDETPVELACQLADVEASSGQPLAEALTGAGLLAPSRLLQFRHPLLRSAVAATITPFERDSLHRQAAALLRARAAPIERIAVHLLKTSPGDDGAAEILRSAATRAVDRGAPEAAVPLLRRALEEPLDPDARTSTLLELGQAERRADRHADAIEHLREAARLTADPLARCDAVISLALSVGPAPDQNRESIPIVTAALDDSASLDHERRLKLQAALLSALYNSQSSEDPRAAQIEAEFAALAGDTPAESIALAQLVDQRKGVLAATELASLGQRAAKHARDLLDGGAYTNWVHGVVMALRWTDRLDDADRLTAEWIETARRHGSADMFCAAYTHRANCNRLRGRLREAEADAGAAVAAAATPVHAVMSRVALVSALLKRGHVDAADAAFREIGIGEHVPQLRPFVGVLLIRVNLNAARGRHDAALADYAEAIRRSDGMRTGPLLDDWLVEIESTHAIGDHDAARAQLDDALEVARWWGTESAIGSVLRVRGRLQRDPTYGIDDLRAATQHLDRSPRRYEHARALVDLGAVLRRAGARADSRDPLRAGYELAHECGADTLAETARQELAASGVRIRRQRLSGVASLTPSERRIAEMAAEGGSNAEIAQALFVTLKTVEMHLTHVYRKLDIVGRSELKRALAQSR